MKILNLRLGHACNSSSSHSIISVNGTVKNDTNGNEFGWDFFTASSQESKMDYFSILVRYCVEEVLGASTAQYILKSMGFNYDESGYIDHQSVITLPTTKHTTRLGIETYEPNYQFIEEMREFFSREDIVVLGGNDNTSEFHPLNIPRGGLLQELPQEDTPQNWKARKDGDWWTLYNRKSGDRITFSFFEEPPEFKPSFPYLVDIKITDLCYYNCAFCYQGSSGKGTHELKLKIRNLAESFQKLEVFEVALGGGEPTVDKERLVMFIEEFSSRDIKVNFTTKNYSWFSDKELREAVVKHCGAVAFSVEEVQDFTKILTKAKEYNFPTSKINIQIVDQVFNNYHLEYLLKEMDKEAVRRLTILGFKENNRGKDFKKKGSTLEVLLNTLKENKYWINIAVDTKFIQDYEKEIKKADISNKLYHKEEGLYSGYIDAVEGTFNKSSYTTEPSKPITNNPDRHWEEYSEILRKIYESWN